MGELVFVGLGLSGLGGLSLEGFDFIKREAEAIFVELYTNILPNFSIEELRESLGLSKEVRLLRRRDLEDLSGKAVLDEARHRRVALLTPGDPLIATTHICLRLSAEKMGIRTRVIHAPSILSAAISACGLQCYKFGRTATVTKFSEVPYEVLKENLQRRLHTLLLLDIDVESGYAMSVREAFETLLSAEARRRENVLDRESLALVLARVGSPSSVVRADAVRELMRMDFGAPPYSIIIPGPLHFMEAEALVALAKAPADLVRRCTAHG